MAHVVDLRVRGVTDTVWRQAKAEAALLGIPMGRFVTDALLVAIEQARKVRGRRDTAVER